MNVISTPATAIAVFMAGLLVTGCSNKDAPAPPPQTATAPAAAIKDAAAIDAPWGTSGRHRAQADSDWVPAEFKKGKAKWRDAGVYIDGECVGILNYPELPPSMKPFWRDDEEKGDPDVQRFRFADYLEAVGVDLEKVKEMHLYGGGLHVMVIKGSQLRKFRDGLHFRFGRGTAGKPILGVPPGLKTNTMFDKTQGVAVYVKKKPPKLNANERVELDGEIVWDMPYFGEPIRGGVRVYKDDRLVLHLKRNKLEESENIAQWTADKSELRWQLGPFLAKYGVDLTDVTSGRVIRDSKREETLTGEELAAAYFTALPQSSGKILLGDDKLVVSALALYSSKPTASGASN